MTTKKPADEVWEEIFDSLVVEAEPPQKYVKRVTITTRDGSTFSVSPQDFSTMIEQEKNLPPGQSDIMSARMSLDFTRIKRDVERWANDFVSAFDFDGKPPIPKFPKPVAGEIPTKRGRRKTVDTAVQEPVKKTRRQKPTS